MTKHTLKAKKRSITGKKVKTIRKEGQLPASLYGAKIKSQVLQVDYKEFEKLYKEVGETGLIEISIEGSKKPQSVLIHGPQRHPLSGQYLHTDFRVVELTEKMKIEVPIEFIGESPATEKNKGVLNIMIEKIEVEALPADLPEQIEVDVSSLEEVGQEIKISDIASGSKYTTLEEQDAVIVKINPLQKEEEPEPTEEAEGEEKAEGDASAENDTPAEGDTKEETPSNEKKE